MTRTIVKNPPHRIRVWQEDNGFSDQEVAEKFDVHKRTVDRWCDGKNVPTLEQAQMVADVTNGFVGLFDWRTSFTDKRRKAAKASLASKTARAPAAKVQKGPRSDPKKLLKSARVGNITKGK